MANSVARQIVRSIAVRLLPAKVQHSLRVYRKTTAPQASREFAHLERLIVGCDVAVDVGANLGVFSEVMARHAKLVLAIEPNPVCIAHLRKVLPRNCEILECAASTEDGEADLVVPRIHGVSNTSLGSIVRGHRFTAQSTVEQQDAFHVTMRPLDSLVQKVAGRRIGVIKIDVEGHEFDVLRGGAATIEKHRPIMFIETETRHGAPVNEVFDFLRRLNYQAKVIKERDVVDADAASLAQWQAKALAGEGAYINNVFFIPGTR